MMMKNIYHVVIFLIICGFIWSVLTYYDITKLPLITLQQSKSPTQSHADEESLKYCGGEESGKCKEISREERIAIMCSKFRVKDRVERYGFLASNDKHNVLYCPMYKVGSTTFISLMYDEHNSKKARRLHHNKKIVSEDKTEYRLKNYFKFMVVRHPFDRLLSAYLEKFNLSSGGLTKKYEKVMHKHFGSEMKIGPKGAIPTLEQFLYLVVTEPVAFHNGHWGNYNTLCHPCVIPYDHVVYMETFQDDVGIILDHFVYSNGSRPALPVNFHLRRAHTDRLQDTSAYFKKIDMKIIDKLLFIYRQDFKIFGYTWDYNTGAGCVKGVCWQIKLELCAFALKGEHNVYSLVPNIPVCIYIYVYWPKINLYQVVVSQQSVRTLFKSFAPLFFFFNFFFLNGHR